MENKMNKKMMKLVCLGAGVALVVVLASVPLSAQEKHHDRSKDAAPTAAAGRMDRHMMHKMHKMQVKKLGDSLEAIDAAIKAVRADDRDEALENLGRARKLVAASKHTMLRMGPIVNVQCPIMGTKIDPAKVPANLTKVYKSGKIGFCCGECPGMWDKLSDEDKAQKLRQSVKVEAKPAKESPGMMMEHGGHGTH